MRPGPKVKPHKERKYPVTVYITGDRMDALGGLEKAKEKALKSLNESRFDIKSKV